MTEQIFLSYAHIDNAKLRTDKVGWIDDFDRALIHELRMRGLKSICWRDGRGIRPDQFFDDIIRNAVDDSHLFIAVVSPNYVDSDYCLDELGRFANQAEKVDRIIKVVKYPINKDDPDSRLPEQLRRRTGYQFFRIDRENGEEYLYWNSGIDPRPEFYDTIRDVARAIKCLLPEFIPSSKSTKKASFLNSQPTASLARLSHVPKNYINRPTGPTIYLAEPSGDSDEAYRSVRGELESKLGAHILPEGPLPRDECAARKTIAELLAKSSHSIHLIGRRYGFIPDGDTDQSIVALQLELAACQMTMKSDFQRFIWCQPDIGDIDPKLQTLLKSFQTEGGLLPSDHFVEETLGRFKSHSIEFIQKMQYEAPRSNASRTTPPIIFLVCHQKDEDLALQFRRFLRDNFEVRISEFDGTEAELSEAFALNAKRADGVLVLYGAATEAWVQDKLHELSTWRSFNRKNDFLAKGVLVAGELTKRKQEFWSPLADVYDEGNITAFTHDLLQGLTT